MTFVPRPGFEDDIRAGDDYRAGMLAIAQQAAQTVETFARQARAPWMPRTGARAVIVAEPTRTGARIVNTDHAGHLQEWGSRNNPPHAPLRRGVRAAGLKLEEQ